MTTPSLETLVSRARDGDAAALDRLLHKIKDDVYGLALRMLWHPSDAEDATQEILIRVVTGLGTFEGRSGFRTWVYRVAVRALLNVKRGRAEAHTLSFDEFGEDLLDGLVEEAPTELNAGERAILQREVKIACTQAMLLCLDRDHRIAYLLGDILELSGTEAAHCLEVSPATYRKRLSRARERINRFVQSSCGIVNTEAACCCKGRIAPAIDKGRIHPKSLLFAEHPVTQVSDSDVNAVVTAITEVCDGRSLMRSNPAYLAPEKVLEQLVPMIDSPVPLH
ncbi:MAG: RNA polymerase sigma factor [Kofleriaceae bacterium]|nr:RNA polymerase sigma factor [Kofleriaceae bacterium]